MEQDVEVLVDGPTSKLFRYSRPESFVKKESCEKASLWESLFTIQIELL
jgi:hypothetical protein